MKKTETHENPSDYAAPNRPAAISTPAGDFVGRVGSQGVARQTAGGKSPRLTLSALAAVFVLPFAIGSGLFWSGWRPEALRNHGQLIQPPRALPPGAAPHGKWLLIVPAADGCAQACQEALRQLQKVHAALGKDRERVSILLPLQGGGREGDGAGIGIPAVPRPHPNPTLEGEGVRPAVFSGPMIIPTADESAWRHALDNFAHAVFVADPMGNVMMRYGEPIDAHKVLRDMERLLKYSWVR